jgi:hypothetical protein
MNILKEHNLKIFSELYDLVEVDHKVNLEKDKDKNYFNFIINNEYYSIGSFYYNNDIRIDLIGKDDNDVFRILEVFDNANEIFNYFYENKSEDLDLFESQDGLKKEFKEELLKNILEKDFQNGFQNNLDKYNNDNLNKINKNRNRDRKYWKKKY